jgi:hypothetical protein
LRDRAAGGSKEAETAAFFHSDPQMNAEKRRKTQKNAEKRR